jgi:8-oxo-dGTP pyrophosphatase MutT (NUDIX family)
MILSPAGRRRLLERLRRIFGAPPPRIQAAALPWRRRADGRLEFLLITSRDTGRWVLPKGWPEHGETLAAAAAREAAEEAGVSGWIDEAECGIYHYEKSHSSGLGWPCAVHVYRLEVHALADEWPERGRRRAWFAPEEAAVRVDEPELAELLRSFSPAVTSGEAL